MSIRASLVDARNAFWLRGCERIGHDPQLHGRPSLELEGGCIRVGDRFRLASRPVVSHLAAGPQGVLEIGSDVSIAHGAAIASFELVRIGDGTQIGPYVIIMDTNFHSGSGDQSVAHDCRPVIIGRHCRIGSRVTITRGVSIGDGAEILAGSVVSSAILPGVCAGGARARVLGRAGDIASRWDSAAAVVPELVMNAFGLDAPVELGSGPADVASWDDAGVVRLLAAIEDRFGVALDRTVVVSARSFADIAETVEDGRRSLVGPRS
jgi:acetyltransferase-like isoleucine patch superfamily enzyme/acyl carrier protein